MPQLACGLPGLNDAPQRRHRARICIARTMPGPGPSSCAGTAIGRQLLRRRRRFKATVFTPDGSQVICTVERPFYLINVGPPAQCGADGHSCGAACASLIRARHLSRLLVMPGACHVNKRKETVVYHSRNHTCSNVLGTQTL